MLNVSLEQIRGEKMIIRCDRTCFSQNFAFLCYEVVLRVLTVALLLCCQACSDSHDQQGKGDKKPEMNQIQKGIPPLHFAQTMVPVRLQRLREGIHAINLGDGEDSVIAKIGPPDEVELSGPKKAYKPDESIRVLVYNVKLVSSTRGNNRDQSVELWFDAKGKLVLIDSSVDGIASRSNKKRDNEHNR
jgi:hypothetical protein